LDEINFGMLGLERFDLFVRVLILEADEMGVERENWEQIV
jgi:hypothetical protein